jgi:hypothetical protein
MLGPERAQSQTFIQLTHQEQAAVGSDPDPLEIDSQRGDERGLKGLVLLLTHWGEPPLDPPEIYQVRISGARLRAIAGMALLVQLQTLAFCFEIGRGFPSQKTVQH